MDMKFRIDWLLLIAIRNEAAHLNGLTIYKVTSGSNGDNLLEMQG